MHDLPCSTPIARTRPGLLVGALLLLLAPALAASGFSAPRPRIGLVLSGGGALGIAHVGVLQALEEMRIPVDVVAGTSMGAIVGGLYAAGYSPAELEGIVGSLDWRELLKDRPDRRAMPYRRKVDDLFYLTRYELGFSGGRLRMPSGFIPGHRLGAALQTLSMRAAGITDFDQLPTPFRAVATDLDTGGMVVLASGDLATALRASMAVPGVFSPVEVDGRLLADGGMVRNLPTDLARAMGAEIVIAVDLGEPLGAQGRPDSIAAVVQRTTDMLTRLNVETALSDADLVIRPRVSGWGLLDFDKWRTILPQGREAVHSVAAELAPLVLPADEWAEFLACRERETPPIYLVRVDIDPGPGLAPEVATHLVRTRPGRLLDAAVLQADLDRLYQLGEFESVGFRLDPEGSGWALSIAAQPKSWGPNYLRFGLALFADLEGKSEFNALTSFTMTRLNRFGGEFKAATQLGSSPFLSGEFYQPVEPSRTLFAAVGISSSQVKTQVPVGDEIVQYRIAQRRGHASLGLQFGRYGEVRAGLRHDAVEAVPTSSHGSDAREFTSTDAGLVFAAAFDQIDNLSMPKRGVLAFVEAYDARPSLGADEAYRKISLQTWGATTAGRHTLLGVARYTSALGGTLPVGQEARLGGLFNLSGLPPSEVSGSYGGMAGLLYLYRLGRLPAFGEGIYAGFSLEAGNLWPTSQAADFSDLRRSYSVFVGLDTILGPIYLAQGVTSGKKDSFYLYVGRTF